MDEFVQSQLILAVSVFYLKELNACISIWVDLNSEYLSLGF